ncbi:MAG: hypothetical protein ACOX4Q_05715 [Syntrophomonadales bacterium]|jgi:hypothetical protein
MTDKYITPVLRSERSPYDDSKLLGEQLLATDDGRPVVAQAWAESGYTYLTYFFSRQGLESCSKDDLFQYLVEQGFKLNREMRYAALTFTDQAGNECWNFTITVGEPND